jgi:hypothetical protein
MPTFASPISWKTQQASHLGTSATLPCLALNQRQRQPGASSHAVVAPPSNPVEETSK